MKKRHVLAVAGSLALAWSTAAVAQLAPANDMGVALAHIHLAVKDVEATKQFFTTMLGGKLVTNGPLALIEFPGIFVMLRQADAAAPPAGSVVDHFGLVYKGIEAARGRWTSGGVKVFRDPSLPGPVSMDRVHLYPAEADIKAMQAWYAKVFGGFPGQRQRVARPGVIEVDYFHRFNFSFSAGMGKPRRRRDPPSIISASM